MSVHKFGDRFAVFLIKFAGKTEMQSKKATTFFIPAFTGAISDKKTPVLVLKPNGDRLK